MGEGLCTIDMETLLSCAIIPVFKFVSLNSPEYFLIKSVSKASLIFTQVYVNQHKKAYRLLTIVLYKHLMC